MSQKLTKQKRGPLTGTAPDSVQKLAMLQFSPEEIGALLADAPTTPEAGYVRGILEGQKVIRLALMQNANNGDTGAATAFLKLLAKS